MGCHGQNGNCTWKLKCGFGISDGNGALSAKINPRRSCESFIKTHTHQRADMQICRGHEWMNEWMSGGCCGSGVMGLWGLSRGRIGLKIGNATICTSFAANAILSSVRRLWHANYCGAVWFIFQIPDTIPLTPPRLTLHRLTDEKTHPLNGALHIWNIHKVKLPDARI